MTNKYVLVEIYKNLQEFLVYRNVKSDYQFVSSDKFVSAIAPEYIKITGTRDDKHGKRAFVLFLIAPESKYAINVPWFKKLLATIDTKTMESDAEIVFISENPLTNFIITQLNVERTTNRKLYIEHYEYKIFTIVVPKHILVPKHTIASDTDVENFCKTFYTVTTRFPKILVTDPPVVWLGAKPGDVIRIDRDSEITVKSIGYRTVIR